MSLLPDPTTAYIDPFRTAKTLVINFFIHDPITGEPLGRAFPQYAPVADRIERRVRKV